MEQKIDRRSVEEGERARLVIDKLQIAQRIKEIAQQISADYSGKCPILIGVLNGSFIFLADLIRELTIDCEVDFIKLSSYKNETVTSGKVTVFKDLNCEIEGRDVLVVEDIVDSGLSIQFIKNYVGKLKPRSLKYAVLLVKEGAEKVNYSVDYCGFKVQYEFLVGYGLDCGQILRNLPQIYALKG